MGMIYKSSDSQDLINGMNANINVAKKATEELLNASQTLTDSIGSGKMLDGEAFNAGKDLFSALIIPTINQAATTVDDMKTHLSQYESANGQVSGEGVLDEDKLNEKRNSTMSLQTATNDTASAYRTIAAANALLCPQLALIFSEKAISLDNYADSLQQDIEKIDMKLKKLYAFDSEVNGLFDDDLNKMKLVWQSVSVLEGTAVNAKTGSYELPAGTDDDWFKNVKAEKYDSISMAIFSESDTTLGYELFASSALWVDENGQLHSDGSAEASAFLANLKTDGEFEIAGIKFNGEGHAFVGAEAAVDLKTRMSDYGYELSLKAEALLGAKAGAGGGFTVGEEILSLRGDGKAEAIAGLWGKAEGEFNISQYGISAFGKAEAKAGAEAKASGNLQAGDGPFKYGVEAEGAAFAGAKADAKGMAAFDLANGNVGLGGKVGAFAGASASVKAGQTLGYTTGTAEVGVKAGIGGSIGGSIVMEDWHVKGDVNLGVALGLGFEVKLAFDFDYGSMLEDAKDFGSWLNPFD